MSMINEGTLAMREEIERLEKEISSLKDRLADQVVQVLAYKVLVSELDEEIASLKIELKDARNHWVFDEDYSDL